MKKIGLQHVQKVWLKPHPHIHKYPETFSFQIQKFPYTHCVFKCNLPVHTHLMVSGFTLEKLGLHVVLPYLLFSKRLNKILLHVYHQIRKKKKQIHHPQVVGFITDFFFHTAQQINKYPDSLQNSLDMCGQKPYPERKSYRFKNIEIHVDRA